MGGWNFIDRTNMRFGKLVAQKYLGNKKWLCHCDCGNDCVVNSDRLPMNSKRRMQKSCGCLLESRLLEEKHFFDIIDTEEKAYILGFAASDGTVSYDTNKSSYSLKFVVNSVDTQLLEEFRQILKSKVQVKTFETITNLPQGGTCTSEMSSVLFCSKTLVEGLIDKGVTPRKSLTLNIDYLKIPDNLKRHFWRGLFDGDGTFGLFGKKKNLEVSLTTSKTMAESTKKEILKLFPSFKVNFYERKECSGQTYNLIFTTQKDGFSFLQYMYEDCNIKLTRKFEKYKTIKQIINSNDYPEKE